MEQKTECTIKYQLEFCLGEQHHSHDTSKSPPFKCAVASHLIQTFMVGDERFIDINSDHRFYYLRWYTFLKYFSLCKISDSFLSAAVLKGKMTGLFVKEKT